MPASKTNPWGRKAIKSRHSEAIASSPLAKKLAARRSRSRLKEYGISTGDLVRATWSYPGGNGTFVGVLEDKRRGKEGDFFTLRDNNNVIVDLYVPMVTGLSRV